MLANQLADISCKIGCIEMNIALSFLVAFVMLAGGAAHFAKPADFAVLMPSFLPTNLVNYTTGGLQIIIGILALFPLTRALGGLAFVVLCSKYLLVHL
jgi:uncharacterized membrane protein